MHFTLRVLIFATLFAADAYCIQVSLEDCKGFPGNWSLAPEEVHIALQHATYDKTFKILEFGAGEGTVQLAALLKRLHIPYEYHSFENAPEYITTIDGVTFYPYVLPPVPWGTLWEWRKEIVSIRLPDLPTVDLVIVDGPHGVSRADWYPKFKEFTRPGTILLIDDFHHYKEFGEALDANFAYETIIEHKPFSVNKSLEITGPKCFKIVKVIGIKL